jgi:Cytochrome c554 and c-prime
LAIRTTDQEYEFMPVMQQQRMAWGLGAASLVVCVLAGVLISNGADQNRAVADEPTSTVAYRGHEVPDPVKANGAIFVDWPKPDVALLISGETDGYLEPCGCAGLENQKGGVKRRHTLIKQLRAGGWPIVSVDLGGLVKRTGVQAELKYTYILRALAEMGYGAVGFGAQDLRLDMLSLVLNMDEAPKLFTSANVALLDFDSGYTERFKVIEAGGVKFGVTSVLGKREIAELKNSEDLQFTDPVEALRVVVPKLKAAGCDHLILLAYAEPEESVALARQFPDFDFVVTAHGADEPPDVPRPIDGINTKLMETGHKGMYVVVLGFYTDGAPSFRYQRVPLDHRFSDSPEMQQVMVDYQKDLQTLGLEGLGLKPTMHPTGRRFAGSETCADCHTAATDVYLKTPHHHATQTLVDLVPPRHYDPECLSCHVTGWEPQKYFPFVSGYLSLEKTPAMVGNGCENCHGPAARHAAAENGEIDVDEAELERLRAALRLQIVPNEGNMPGQEYANGKVVQMCMQCHDLDNSPDFDFQAYWPQVEHKGKD